MKVKVKLSPQTVRLDKGKGRTLPADGEAS